MSRTTESTNIRQLLEQASSIIQSDSARLDAEVLLSFSLQKPRSYLLTWPERVPDNSQQEAFAALVQRRCHGEPIAHITGQREFWSLQLTVTPDTLIPRPETETLVSCALELIPTDSAVAVADLGTGSGAIALAIASERPRCQLLANDCSQAALDCAQSNAARLAISNVEFSLGHWCDALGNTQFDLIVSNPPYIADGDPHLDSGDVRFEPRTALTAGADGLDAIDRIADCARNHLVAGGWLLLEHGFEQGQAVRERLERYGYRTPHTRKDLTGLDRITLASL